MNDADSRQSSEGGRSAGSQVGARALPDSSVGSAGEPLFDYPTSLARLGGDQDLFNEILDIFLEDAPTLLEKAAQALSVGDAATLERSAHSLKGLSANFAAGPTVAAAYAVEFHAREHNMPSAGVCFRELESQFHLLDAALREWRSQGRSA
jgi:HPt (histidine-containing phosphotransfer) domain-containing protein